MVMLIAAVDAAAIGIYFLADLRAAQPGVRTAFTVAWTVATMIIVLTYLRRIRMARRR